MSPLSPLFVSPCVELRRHVLVTLRRGEAVAAAAAAARAALRDRAAVRDDELEEDPRRVPALGQPARRADLHRQHGAGLAARRAAGLREREGGQQGVEAALEAVRVGRRHPDLATGDIVIK